MATETEELRKALDTAIARISTMEGELRAKPKAAETPPAPVFDIFKFRQALALDPVGTMRSMQMSPEHIEHVRTSLLVDQLGDNAPAHLRMTVQQGPQMMAVAAQGESLAMLSRRLDERDAREQSTAKRESFKSISANKEKYPNLAKAVAADPELISELEKHGGTAEEFAASQEAKLTKLAAVFAPPAGSVKPDNSDQSKQVMPTPLAGALGGDPPVIVKNPGGWSRDAFTKTRDEIVQKYARPKV